MPNVNRHMARGAAWMVLFKLIERSIGLVSMLILARLLVPADFGLVAMATSVAAMLELLGAFSFDVALIQRQQADRHHYDTAWTLNVMFQAFIALCLCALAPLMSDFYDEPRLPAIMFALALAFAVQGWENIGVVAFRKELDFRKEFRFQLAKKAIGFAVTIPLAFLLRSYWALVIGMITGRIAGVLISYLLHPFRPRFSLAGAADLFGFSKWLAVNNVVTFLNLRASDFIVAKLAGPQALGIFSLSYELSNLATTEIAAPINRAVLPGYAKLADRPAELRDSFLGVFSLLAAVALPAAAGIAFSAHRLVPVLLGDNWLAAIPIVQWLGWFGALFVLQNNCYVVFLARGQGRIQVIMSGFQAITLLAGVTTLTSAFGLPGAAWAHVATLSLTMPISLGIVARHLDFSVARYFPPLWRPAAGVACMGLAIHAVDGPLDALPPLAALLLLVATGAASYALTVLATWWLADKPRGAEAMVVQALMERLRPANE